ncbi:MAG TPA: hypothetical protein VJ898_06475 [Natrialbaceae archaeon]|nr:hypothetical protein [Natrialbaceae archaeon]
MSADQPDEPTAIDRPPTAETRPTPGDPSPHDDFAPFSSNRSLSIQQAALQETRIAVLQSRVSALEDALETERDRRRAVVDRYERILEERDETRDEPPGEPSLRDRLRQFLSF